MVSECAVDTDESSPIKVEPLTLASLFLLIHLTPLKYYDMRKILLAFVVIALTACGKKISFLPSTVIPTAKGYVKIKADKNDNYAVRLEVKDIVKSKDLQPSKKTYVVWVETLENRSHHLGKLESSKSLFSGTRKGKLETVTAAKPVRVFVTAEENGTPQFPSEVVLTTKLFKMR